MILNVDTLSDQLLSPMISQGDSIISSQSLPGDLLTLSSPPATSVISLSSQHSSLAQPIRDQSLQSAPIRGDNTGQPGLMSPLLSPQDPLSLSPSQLGPLSPQSPSLPLPPPSPSHQESWDEDKSGDNY